VFVKEKRVKCDKGIKKKKVLKMRKILIFGNSSAGKSTLAKRLIEEADLLHLDLDTIAWRNVKPSSNEPPVRMPLTDSGRLIQAFTQNAKERDLGWVIEGCYTDLLELAKAAAGEVIFLNLSIGDCLQNAKVRPWEPHKYESKEQQDANLSMLIEWIKEYETRTDGFSLAAHQQFYDNFVGIKTMITKREDV